MANVIRSNLMRGLRHMSQASEKVSIAPKIRPSNMEKRFLVWSGKYKTAAEIPEFVPLETNEKAKSKARIRITNYFIGFGIIGCILSIIEGKRAVRQGESTLKSNMEWHQKVKEDYELSKAKSQ